MEWSESLSNERGKTFELGLAAETRLLHDLAQDGPVLMGVHHAKADEVLPVRFDELDHCGAQGHLLEGVVYQVHFAFHFRDTRIVAHNEDLMEKHQVPAVCGTELGEVLLLSYGSRESAKLGIERNARSTGRTKVTGLTWSSNG